MHVKMNQDAKSVLIISIDYKHGDLRNERQQVIYSQGNKERRS